MATNMNLLGSIGMPGGKPRPMNALATGLGMMGSLSAGGPSPYSSGATGQFSGAPPTNYPNATPMPLPMPLPRMATGPRPMPKPTPMRPAPAQAGATMYSRQPLRVDQGVNRPSFEEWSGLPRGNYQHPWANNALPAGGGGPGMLGAARAPAAPGASAQAGNPTMYSRLPHRVDQGVQRPTFEAWSGLPGGNYQHPWTRNQAPAVAPGVMGGASQPRVSPGYLPPMSQGYGPQWQAPSQLGPAGMNGSPMDAFTQALMRAGVFKGWLY